MHIREFLKKMNKFEEIRLNQLLVLMNTFKESKLLTRDNIRKKYLVNEIHYDAPLSFLKKLNLVKESNSNYNFDGKFNKLINSSSQEIIDFLINVLLNLSNYYSHELINYFENFKIVKGEYEFVPSVTERLKFSSIRNFLLELGVLTCVDKNRYVVLSKYNNSLLFQELSSPKLSQALLEKYLQANKDIGLKAEKFVLDYEKEKFINFPNIVKKIDHTSIVNVSAGYDIKSYLINKGEIIEIYIEVKAVSLSDWSFRWTSNEIKQAFFFADKYYLYLIPAGNNGKFEKTTIRIIKNPYENIYNNSFWNRQNELVLFTPKKTTF